MKKSIAFVTAGLSFTGDTLETSALGGSETALIYMAKHLASLHNHVYVFCNCETPGIYDGVIYQHHDLFSFDDRGQFDVVIVSRYSEFFFDRPIDSKLNILWCHDTHSPLIKETLGIIDNIFLLSDYHINLYKDQFDIDDGIIYKTKNGFDNSLVQLNTDFKRRKDHYIYASRPERGLKKLLKDIWPNVLRINPDAILHLCGYQSFPPTEELKQLYDECYQLKITSKNIIDHGELTKREYYNLLQSCAFMLYPTDFPEISCINAIEAQANNCLVISTNEFALKETVKSNTLIDKGHNYNDYFLSEIQRYQNENLWIDEVVKANYLIQDYDWKDIAIKWNYHIDNLFKARFNNEKCIDQLIYNSDLVCANKFRDVSDKLEKAKNDNLSFVFNPTMQNEFSALTDRGIKLLSLVQEIIEKDPTVKLKILDVGCNDGILSLPLLKEFGNNIEELVGIDMCDQSLQLLKDNWVHKYPQLSPEKLNVIELANLNKTFDLVICGEILEHIEDTKSFLIQLMKVGHEQTYFFFTTPKGPWESIIKDNPDINHIHHFEYDDILSIFKYDVNIVQSKNFVQGRKGELCSNYVFWFQGNNRQFGEINYEEKLLKTRPYKSISCCMITKNEEDNLSRCLKTVKDIVDEIIIVDTGSTDDTKYIAKKFTDKIYDLKWEEEDGLGNFARARNESIKYAKGDYIFWIDADEQLENKTNLFKFIQSDYYDSILVKQKHVLPRDRHSQDINTDPYPDRLFKNNGRLKFEGVIHEFVSNDGSWVKKCLFQDAFWILHYGNTNLDILKSKSLGRNPSLIEKNARLYPDSLMAKHYQVVDLWSKFVSDPSPDYFIKAREMWNLYFINCKDKFAQRGTYDIIQKFYKAALDKDIGIQSYKFSNGKTEVDIYAFNEQEANSFLSIL